MKAGPGFRGGALLADRSWAFWTMTAWDGHDESWRKAAPEGEDALIAGDFANAVEGGVELLLLV